MTHRTSLRGALVALTLMVAASASADTCRRPRVVLSVDRSSSMLDPLAPGWRKWDAAREALRELSGALDGRADVGVQVFPYPHRCEPGAVIVEIGEGTPEVVDDALFDEPPGGGNFTPMAETLDVLGRHATLLDPDVPSHVVLVTDGWQWCSPHDPARRFAPVDAALRLREIGVTVHVVGFGAGVDALTLNRTAVAGGHPRDGCDPMLEDPAGRGHCYHAADDLMDLRVALATIARSITEERCNGRDDDCDGTVDEGYDEDGDGYPRCVADDGLFDCDDLDPGVHPAGIDRCDGVDRNCDGIIDAACRCEEGAMASCGESTGACEPGRRICVGGTWSACEGGVVARVNDECDGRDEDCDGHVDEGADCGPGSLCLAGACGPVAPAMPPAVPLELVPEEETPVPTLGGCACRTTEGRGLPVAFVWLLWLLRGLGAPPSRAGRSAARALRSRR